MANSTARLFNTGSVPGRPRQTGQVFAFGASPNCVEQPQKIFVLVRSCACTSRPITASYLVMISGAIPISAASLVIRMSLLYHRRYSGLEEAALTHVRLERVPRRNSQIFRNAAKLKPSYLACFIRLAVSRLAADDPSEICRRDPVLLLLRQAMIGYAQ